VHQEPAPSRVYGLTMTSHHNWWIGALAAVFAGAAITVFVYLAPDWGGPIAVGAGFTGTALTLLAALGSLGAARVSREVQASVLLRERASLSAEEARLSSEHQIATYQLELAREYKDQLREGTLRAQLAKIDARRAEINAATHTDDT